ncbi:MAG: hypothetical protein ACR2FN_00155 [Chitinophagaceae bacterium]
MKYSQTIGIIASISLIIICFLPWSFIASKNILVYGMHAEGTDFGKPGLLNLILCFITIVLFLIPKIWSKRLNVFIAALNLAWSIRNYFLISSCIMGDCPVKKTAIYLLPLLSLIILLMSFLPKINMEKTKNV